MYSPRSPFWLYDSASGQLSNPMGSIELGYEPRISRDGSRILKEYTGELYDRSFALLGQLPTPPVNDEWALTALTPDGNRVLVLHKTFTGASHGTLASIAVDVYSTSGFVAGTTNFAKIATIPVSSDASYCNPAGSTDCYYGNQYLLPSGDSKVVFWIGNLNMQVIPLP
jgi:hypothetical protein